MGLTRGKGRGRKVEGDGEGMEWKGGGKGKRRGGMSSKTRCCVDESTAGEELIGWFEGDGGDGAWRGMGGTWV